MKNRIKTFFGWLFMTEAYMASLSDDEVVARALGKKRAAEWKVRDAEFAALLARVARHEPGATAAAFAHIEASCPKPYLIARTPLGDVKIYQTKE